MSGKVTQPECIDVGIFHVEDDAQVCVPEIDVDDALREVLHECDDIRVRQDSSDNGSAKLLDNVGTDFYRVERNLPEIHLHVAHDARRVEFARHGAAVHQGDGDEQKAGDCGDFLHFSTI